MRRLMGSVSPASGRPSISTEPESGRTSPAIMETVVVLPAPLGPSSPTVSPGARAKRHTVDRDHVAVALLEIVDFEHGGVERSYQYTHRPRLLFDVSRAPADRSSNRANP